MSGRRLGMRRASSCWRRRLRVLAQAWLLLASTGLAARFEASPTGARVRQGAARRRALSYGVAWLLGSAPTASSQLIPAGGEEVSAAMDTNGDGRVDRVEFLYFAKDSLDTGGFEGQAVRKSLYGYVGALYHAADVDGDGTLDVSEINFARHLATEDPTPENMDFGLEKNQHMVELLDRNKNGLVDAHEFEEVGHVVLSTLLSPFMSTELTDDEVLALPAINFREGDKNLDGGLGAREFQYALWLLSDVVVKEFKTSLLRDYDRDGDGRISSAEAADRFHSVSHVADQRLKVATILRDGFPMFDADDSDDLDDSELEMVAVALLKHM